MEKFHQLLALMASSPVLDASTQHRLAVVGEQARSSSGDRILVELARRPELAPQARSIVEASSRASVRATWLSRGDHSDGYVRSSIEREKRVTVLAAIAGQPGISDELVDMLASVDAPLVATAVLRREGKSKGAVRACVSTLARSSKLSYAQAHIARQAVMEHPDLWDDFAKDAVGSEHLRFLSDTRGYQFPASALPRVTRLLLKGWEAEISLSVRGRWSPQRLELHMTNLVSQQSWIPGSREDRGVAEVLKAMHGAGKNLGNGALRSCFLRHFGTPQEQADQMSAASERAAALKDASSTADEQQLMAYAKSADRGLHQAIAGNPNVRPRHLAAGQGLGDAAKSLRRLPGEEGLLAAAIVLAGDYQAFSGFCEEYDDEQLAYIAREAVCLQRKWGTAHLRSWQWRHYVKDERLAMSVVPAMRIREVTGVLEDQHIDAGTKANVIQAVARMVEAALPEDGAWQVFASMAAELDECSLEETLRISRSV